MSRYLSDELLFDKSSKRSDAARRENFFLTVRVIRGSFGEQYKFVSTVKLDWIYVARPGISIYKEVNETVLVRAAIFVNLLRNCNHECFETNHTVKSSISQISNNINISQSNITYFNITKGDACDQLCKYDSTSRITERTDWLFSLLGRAGAMQSFFSIYGKRIRHWIGESSWKIWLLIE